MVTVIVIACLAVLVLCAIGGCLVFGISSIGVLLALGFELGMFLMPIILIYLVARWVWTVTTSKKKEPEKKAE